MQEGQPHKEPTLARAPAASPWPDLAGVHAFLVEDNEDTRVMVSQTLQHCGAVVTVYESADAAIADLSMPRLNGLEFMRAIRRLPPGRGGTVPAIAVTAYYEEFAAAAALEVGFNAYMTKPIRLEQLARAVKELSAARG
jgi:CheY-like chemotaxis protein